MITAIRPASFFTGRSVRYRIRSWLTRARDSSIALASLSISAPLGWKSGSISDGADSAMAPIGARLDPSLMNAATSTSNWAPIALAALIKLGSNRSEEHTSELQSRPHLVCRLLLEKKKATRNLSHHSHL